MSGNQVLLMAHGIRQGADDLRTATSPRLIDRQRLGRAAAAAQFSVYDLFVWSNSRHGHAHARPAWTNDTTRSAGTALVMVQRHSA